MEFKCLTNIETSFRQLRMYALVFAGVCAVVTVAAVWMSYSFAERQRQKIGACSHRLPDLDEGRAELDELVLEPNGLPLLMFEFRCGAADNEPSQNAQECIKNAKSQTMQPFAKDRGTR